MYSILNVAVLTSQLATLLDCSYAGLIMKYIYIYIYELILFFYNTIRFILFIMFFFFWSNWINKVVEEALIKVFDIKREEALQVA